MSSTPFAALLLGLLTSASPCILPLYPGFLAYLSSHSGQKIGWQRYLLGLAVLAGVLSMMLALGGIITLLAISISRLLMYIIPIADLLIILLGLLLLLDRNPFKALPQTAIPGLQNPLLNAYLYGLLYGPLTLPCSGPLVVSIFALSLTVGEAMQTLLLFVLFGLGFGLPLLLLSFLSGALQQQITRLFAHHSRLINIIGGLLLIGVALYDLGQNWMMLRLLFT